MSLREELKAYYGAKRFPADKLAGLAALATRSRRRWVLPAAAAGVLACVAVLWMLPDGPPTAREIAQEIAAHRRHTHPAEFETGSYDELRGRMQRLDFALLEPHRKVEGLTLRGGRYCSVGGRVAAQIYLADASGRAYTLYEVRAPGVLDPGEETVFQLDGADIHLWQEGDVLLALAK